MARRKKRRAAWASITKVEPNVYRIRFWASGPDGYRRRSKTVRGSRLDAERERSALMLAHSADAPCPTVGEVWRDYALPDLNRRVEAGDLKQSSLDQYSGAWGKHVDGQWSHVQCDAVKALAIQQWLYGMPLNAAREGIGLLRLVFDYAVRYEFCAHNVARERYLMPSRATVEERDKGIWTLDELGELWRIVRGRWMEGAFLLAAFGGLRVSESLGVRASDIDLREVRGVPVAVVRVERQSTKRGGTDTPKTRQSVRVVAIPGRAAVRLAEIAGACGGFVSGDGMGGPSTRFRLHKAWEALPLGDMRHPYRNLRNSYETFMRWTLKLPPWYVEPMLGHKEKSVTGQYYDRPQADLFAEVMADAYLARPFDSGWLFS